MISLCLIVKNEQENIVSCINSFKPIVDKIVVVDTGSTDETKRLALESGASLFEYEWNDSFSDARNFCISKVDTDWVLFVDADERLDLFDLDKLKIEMSSFDVLFCDVVVGSDLIELPRLWRANDEIYYDLPVHEYLVYPSGELNIDRSEAFKIVNKTLDNNLIESRKRYIEIMESYLSKVLEPNLRIYFYLCADNFFVKNNLDSMKWGKLFLEKYSFKDYFYAKANYYLAELEIINENYEEALDYVGKAAVLLDSKVCYELQAYVLYLLGKQVESELVFKKSLKARND